MSQILKGNLVAESKKVMEETVPGEEDEAVLAGRNRAAQVPDVPSVLALWEWDLTTNQVYFSPEYRRQLGAGEGELTNGLSEWETRLHPEDRERVTQGLRSYLANPGPCYEAAYRLRYKDTAYRWMLMRAEVVRDSQNRPCRMLGYQLDISEQRKAGEDQARLAAIV